MDRQLDQWDLVIKVKYGDALRRISAYVHGQLMDHNMATLKTKINSLFKLSPDAVLVLTYTDEDGDVVTLDEDDELRDAVINQRLNPLRINVQLKSPDKSNTNTETSYPVKLAIPQSETLPSVDKEDKSIPEPLLGVVSELLCIAEKTISSSPAFSQKVNDIIKSEPCRNAVEILSKDVKKATSFSPVLAQVVEHFSNLGLSNASQTSGPSDELSCVHGEASHQRRDLNATNEPKASSPILGTIELQGNTTNSVSMSPNQTTSGSKCQGAEGKAPSVDLNTDASKRKMAPLYPIDDLLASICTASKFSEHEKEIGNSNVDEKSATSRVTTSPSANQTLHNSGNLWTPMHPFATYVEAPADIAGGSSSNKQSSPWHTGFNSEVEVSVRGGNQYDGKPMLPEVIKTQSCRRSYINNESMLRTFHRGVQCDGCGMHPIVGPRFKSIVKEDYDLCNICFSQVGNETDYTRIDHAHHRAPRLLKELHNHHAKLRVPPFKVLRGYGRQPRTKLESRFIQDVTVLDGTVMPPTTHFTKIWRLCNNGNVAWPFGTQLVWVGGDQFGNRVSADLEIPPSGLSVDKELDVAVDFTAPSRPGRYVSYWRLASPSGQKFGQRVWVLIQVEYSRPSSAAGSSFHPDLNLNLPPESNGRSVSGIININVEPFDSGLPEANFSETNTEFVRPVEEDLPSGFLEQPAQIVSCLLDANNGEISQSTPVATVVSSSATYPLMDLHANQEADASSPVARTGADDNLVEQTLLNELEEMGFKQIDLNKEILRHNEYDLEQSVDDLCGFAEWYPLLSELAEMGFNDKELNKKLLTKNGGSIKRTVLDLIAGKMAE